MISSDSVVQKQSDACRTMSPRKKAMPPVTVSVSKAPRATSHGMSRADDAHASTISPCSSRPTRRSANSWPASWSAVGRGRSSRRSKSPVFT